MLGRGVVVKKQTACQIVYVTHPSIMPRISVAWFIILAVMGAVAFFGYHIYMAASTTDEINSFPQHNQFSGMNGLANYEHPMEPVEPATPLEMEVLSPVVERMADPLPMPEVVGQTEEDLRETRQVQQTPPDAVYPDPEPVDTTEGEVHSESEFGSNLRHPEQTIEVAPPLGTLRMVESGVGSEQPTPTFAGKHDPTVYSPETAQNGGEFMSGIWAYDGGDGFGYSSI